MKIVCLGDSFTKGFGVEKGECWFELLSAEMTHTLVNKGVNGDTSGGMLARFQNDVVKEKPHYVLIEGGTNDFICDGELSAVKANMMGMVHQAYNMGIIPVIGIVPVCIPHVARRDWAAFTDFNVVKEKQNQCRLWTMDFCKTFNVGFVDFDSEFTKKIGINPAESYYIDGLHLTPAGHVIIKEIAAEAFKHI